VDFLQTSGDASTHTAVGVAVRLVFSGLLGAVISVLYRLARSPEARNRGLVPTLVLLSMMITLVTIAVGTSVAVAFTLVGTLAIVRFRTTVSDIRDTVFVIFAVAVGIAVNQNWVTAVVGTLIIGAAIGILRMTGTMGDARLSKRTRSGPLPASLTIAFVPPSADPSQYEPVLERFGVRGRLLSTKVERDKNRLSMTMACQASPEGANQLLLALLENPEIVDASIRFEP